MSSRRTAHVTTLEYRTDEQGAEIEVRVRVVNEAIWYVGQKADARDLNPEAADALREWLKGAPTAKETP